MMEAVNISSDSLISQPIALPFTFNLLVFLILFFMTALYSAVILWFILRFFHQRQSHNQVKTAFIVSLISNLAASLLFSVTIRLAPVSIWQTVSSSKLLFAAVNILVFVVTFGINLFVAKKFYRLPAKQAFRVILIWTSISFLASNVFTQLLAPVVANVVVLLFYPTISIAANSPAVVLK